ncbi:hypothetical protein WMY93_033837 [Mugilogobius chulae]|uniref:Uncharacterized protein n=1 Tax=Mugilogobius chulae TaxID=88201 RepID=A0AAW0MJW8_9GOBI
MFVSNRGQNQPLSASLGSDTGDVLIRSTRANLRVQRHEPAPLQNTDTSAAARPDTAPPPPAEDELQTIRLAAGARGAGLEALRQRSQTLTDQTLHRLETVHNQQLTLQNQLLDSALKMVLRPEAPPTSHLRPEAPPTSHLKPEAPPTSHLRPEAPPTSHLSSEFTSANQSRAEAGLGASDENRPRTQKNPRTFPQQSRSSLGKKETRTTNPKVSRLKSGKGNRSQEKSPGTPRRETERREEYSRGLEERLRKNQERLRNQEKSPGTPQRETDRQEKYIQDLEERIRRNEEHLKNQERLRRNQQTQTRHEEKDQTQNTTENNPKSVKM